MGIAGTILVCFFIVLNLFNVSWFIYRKYYKGQRHLSWMKDVIIWF